ncbi:MAG TPA: nucleotidyltransferase family protein [Thermoanaerobaculia bacterium]|nr:nucleotidyltransferase family protein [Thermoanaerobaculia bacterium]
MLVDRQLAIPIPHEAIATFCRKWGIRRLAFFGSVVRDDFTPDSDVDVLVEFKPDRIPGWEFFGTMPDELSEILSGRRVDLLTFDSISRWIRPNVMGEAVDEYTEV